ncbi:hypothetical protein PQR64_35705 [Paraburkholderia phytofirmans]|uniref:hypothetical protein n=1 Tax=Paraburkholderia phytofirmans TaxID=261302 RepID=UPI0038B77450
MAIPGNWFEDETSKLEFDSPAASGLPVLFPVGTTAAGGQYYSVPKEYLNRLLSIPGGSAGSSVPLSENQISQMRAILEAQRGGLSAGAIALKVAGEIPLPANALSLAAGKLMDWLAAEVDAKRINIDRLVDFITIGGEAYFQVAFRPGPAGFKPRLFVTSGYHVQVGREPKPRSWIFSAGVIPMNVVLAKIETANTGDHAGNKRLEPNGDGTWKSWDIDEQKYDNHGYRFSSQDEVFAYFYDNPSNDPNDAWRINLYGGSMDRTRNGGVTWATVYQKVETS